MSITTNSRNKRKKKTNNESHQLICINDNQAIAYLNMHWEISNRKQQTKRNKETINNKQLTTIHSEWCEIDVMLYKTNEKNERNIFYCSQLISN